MTVRYGSFWTEELKLFAFSFDDGLVPAGVIYNVNRFFKWKPEDAALVRVSLRVVPLCTQRKMTEGFPF